MNKIIVASLLLLSTLAFADAKKQVRGVAEMDQEIADQLARKVCMGLSGDIIGAEEKLAGIKKRLSVTKSAKQKKVLEKKMREAQDELDGANSEFDMTCKGS